MAEKNLSKQADKIRCRKSYADYSGLLKAVLEAKGDPVPILQHVHLLLDNLRAFRSQKASDYAQEACNLVIADYQNRTHNG